MNDIVTIRSFRCDLNSGPCIVSLQQPLMHQDALGDVFAVSVHCNEQPIDLSDVTVYGFLLHMVTGQTIPLKGAHTGNCASVALTEPCYALPGDVKLTIQVKQGTVRHTVLHARFTIVRTGSERILDLNSLLPSASELLSIIDDLRAAQDFANAKLNANLGTSNAGMLLYVSATGAVLPLSIGSGLEIQNGVLSVTGAGESGGTGGSGDSGESVVLLAVDTDGAALLTGANLTVDANGAAALTGASLTVDEAGAAIIA